MNSNPADLHPSILKRFNQLKNNGRLAHAYLFVGPTAIGKTQTALSVAKMLNCEASLAQAELAQKFFCDRCPSCLKIEHGNHPDIHWVKVLDEEDSIKIEQIRQLITISQLRAFEAKYKVFIIQQAERLTTESANALLKTLEEPAKNSLIILTTSTLEKNLDTIRSRCHYIYFSVLGQAHLAQMLMEKEGLDDSCAHFLSGFSQGSLGEAYRLIETKMFEQKNRWIDEFLKKNADVDGLKTVLADREAIIEFLKLLLSWVRDLRMVKANLADQRLIHQDRLAELKEQSRLYREEELDDLFYQTTKTIELRQENLNIKVPVLLLKERICKR